MSDDTTPPPSKTDGPPPETLWDMLGRLARGPIPRALPSHLTTDRFYESCCAAIMSTRNIWDATLRSVEASIMSAAQMGIELATPTGAGHLVVRKNKDTTQCQFQLGYQGMIDLALRSGLVRSIIGITVHKGDLFEEHLGDRPRLVHRRQWGAPRTEDTMVAAYAVAQFSGGGSQFVVLEPAEIYDRRDRGGYNPKYPSPWKSDFLAMAAKTAVRDLYPWLPKSPQMVAALRYMGDSAADPAVDDGDGSDHQMPPPLPQPETQDAPPPWDGKVDLTTVINAGTYKGARWCDVGDEEWLVYVLGAAVKNERVCKHATQQLANLRAADEQAKKEKPADAAKPTETAAPAKPKPEPIDPMTLLVPAVVGQKPGTRWCDMHDIAKLSGIIDREGDGGIDAAIADRAMARIEQLQREVETKTTAATAPGPAKQQAPKAAAK